MRRQHPRRTLRPELIVLAALILVGVLASVPVAAEAAAARAVDCGRSPSATGDADGDGISDFDECKSNGITTAGGTPVTIPSCFNGSTRVRTSGCLDPNSKNLFVILVRAATSLIPTTNPLEFVTNPPSGSPAVGLGLTIHEIANSAAVISTGSDDRIVLRPPSGTNFAPTYAVRVTENTADLSSGTVLGQATNGTPVTTGKVVVWPVRILQHVNEVRAAGGLSAVLGTDAIVVRYIKQVIAHEMGHVMGPMANVDATTASLYGGKHYAPTPGVIMSQYVTTDEILNMNNLQIPDDFTTGDQSALKLK